MQAFFILEADGDCTSSLAYTRQLKDADGRRKWWWRGLIRKCQTGPARFWHFPLCILSAQSANLFFGRELHYNEQHVDCVKSPEVSLGRQSSQYNQGSRSGASNLAFGNYYKFAVCFK